MWTAVLGILDKLLGLLPLLGAWLAGRDRQKAVDLDKGLKGLDDAIKARDRVRTDPAYRDSLRDRYRNP